MGGEIDSWSHQVWRLKTYAAGLGCIRQESAGKKPNFLKSIYIKPIVFSAKFKWTRIWRIWYYARGSNFFLRVSAITLRWEIKTVVASFFINHFRARLQSNNFCERDFRNKLGLICQWEWWFKFQTLEVPTGRLFGPLTQKGWIKSVLTRTVWQNFLRKGRKGAEFYKRMVYLTENLEHLNT